MKCTFAIVLIAIGLTAVPASAQILYGSVVGVVKDSTGAVIPGATVTIVNKETNLTRETTTERGGCLQPDQRPAGAVRRQGHAHGVPRRGAAQRAGHASARSPASTSPWKSARSTETVMVVGESPLLQTDKADVHTKLKSAEHHATCRSTGSATSRRCSTWCPAPRRWRSATRKPIRRRGRWRPTSTARRTRTTRPAPTAPRT